MRSSFIITRQPKNKLENLIWDSGLWKVYQPFTEKKHVEIFPTLITLEAYRVAIKFYNTTEKAMNIITPKDFLFVAETDPKPFINMIATVVDSDEKGKLKIWLNRFASAQDVAESYLALRKAMLDHKFHFQRPELDFDEA